MTNAAQFLRVFVVSVASLVVLRCGVANGDYVLSVDPRATYLRTSPLDTLVADTVPIDLFALDLSPGDQIRLERVGAYNPYGQTNAGWPPSDTFEDMIGVFSSSPDLMSRDLIHRIPGAIDAGPDVDTYLTWEDNLPRDIGEDFWISGNDFWTGFYQDHSVTLRIPNAARYLFVSALDSYFGDNDDPNADYGVRITAVPAPSTLITLVGVGVMVFGAGWWEKRRRR